MLSGCLQLRIKPNGLGKNKQPIASTTSPLLSLVIHFIGQALSVIKGKIVYTLYKMTC